MIIRCAVCKKQVVVQWPELWGYKRKNRFMCSWKCLRAFDNKEKGAKEVYTKTKKDGTPAKKSGPKPKAEPEVELVYDPSIMEEYRREQAQKAANEKARNAEPVTEEKTETDQRDLFHTAAIRNKRMGTFYYDEKFRTIDWRNPFGEEISLPPEDWKWLGDHIYEILIALGVEV